jgi:aspartyl-tRNA(Asn)/glutamyl-tRNA(Gln) amidotransferase subunit A
MASTETQAAITELTLSQAARKVAAAETSPVELVETCIERIRATDDVLRAYISVYDEQARKVARAAEAMIEAGHRLGPLHGIPVAVKDQIGMAHLPSTAGSKVLADWRPTEDAPVVSALKGAGAIVVGKTNQHEFAWGGTSANPHYGFVRNPWDTERFPAGSSGGSGVAVAARTCYGALGTDTGGSIRLPSAVNGIVGLRPTIGRVSNRGVIPLAWSMDTVGPMTRTVADCALMFGVIAGHDAKDPGTALCPLTTTLPTSPAASAACGSGSFPAISSITSSRRSTTPSRQPSRPSRERARSWSRWTSSTSTATSRRS